MSKFLMGIGILFFVGFVVLFGGIGVLLVWNKLHVDAVRSELRALPIMEGMVFHHESSTSFPDSTPSIIHSYFITPTDNPEEIVEFYKTELKKLEWELTWSSKTHNSQFYSSYQFKKHQFLKNKELYVQILAVSDEAKRDGKYDRVSLSMKTY